MTYTPMYVNYEGIWFLCVVLTPNANNTVHTHLPPPTDNQHGNYIRKY